MIFSKLPVILETMLAVTIGTVTAKIVSKAFDALTTVEKSNSKLAPMITPKATTTSVQVLVRRII